MASSEKSFEFDCETFDAMTLYAFTSRDPDMFMDLIGIWTDYLFSSDDLNTINSHIRSIVIKERNIVDEEFHEKRNNLYNFSKTAEILKSTGLIMPKFGMGNLTTLQENADHLIADLEALRELYRKRPVFVCIYSHEKLHMVKKKEISES